ncbi:MAG: hypothetical protein P4M05_29340 [Bradyrhizobium sp.]|nr:hypothetical protein [Bradyrhizobium sp.]
MDQPLMGSQAGALDRLLVLPDDAAGDSLAMASALADAAAAIARLDQALASHPLRHAFLYRARLDAVRRQAAVDGELIDPWHLAALLEGLRLNMDPYLRIIDRGRIRDAVRTALGLHQWFCEPDFDQEGEIQRAEALLASLPASLPPLLAGAQGMRRWIDGHEARAPMRAALVRFWTKRQLLRMPIPLTGAAALGAEASWEPRSWLPNFLRALEREAGENLDLLVTMERCWFAARRAITGRRKNSHAAAAVDVLAAAPVISAVSLARILGIAVKNALRLLDELCAAGIAIEVTHRSKRRLFGLAGLAPLRDSVRPPYRPERNRGPGRPRHDMEEEPFDADGAPAPVPPLSPLERVAFDYSALEDAMAHLDDVVRRTRQALTPQNLKLHPQSPAAAQTGNAGDAVCR